MDKIRTILVMGLVIVNGIAYNISTNQIQDSVRYNINRDIGFFMWAFPFGPGFPLQILGEGACGFFAAIPNAKKNIALVTAERKFALTT